MQAQHMRSEKGFFFSPRQSFGNLPARSPHEGADCPRLLNSGFACRARSPPPGPIKRVTQPSLPVAAPQRTQQRPASNPSTGGVGNVVRPGDVIYVQGAATGFWNIGAAGGFMGHVLVAIGSPEVLPQHSEEHRALQAHSGRRLPELWRIPTVESTRGQEGLHYAHLVVYVEPGTGRLVPAGELSNDRSEIHALNPQEQVELWQSPPEIRGAVSPELVANVLDDMEHDEQDWSYTTAMRAVFLSHNFVARDRRGRLSELQQCWKSKPICTSVVISFWQRLLCSLSRGGAHPRNSFLASPVGAAVEGDAYSLILRWMPLMADRGLPGELLQSMHECGWRMLKTVPA